MTITVAQVTHVVSVQQFRFIWNSSLTIGELTLILSHYSTVSIPVTVSKQEISGQIGLGIVSTILQEAHVSLPWQANQEWLEPA
jgi:hypothetical protein